MTTGSRVWLANLHSAKKCSHFANLSLRNMCTSSKFSFFITTPIFYVNAAPHLGHLHSAVLADALHRFYRMLGANKTIFSTGTDEHGMKVQQAALGKGESVWSLCDTISSKFQELFQVADIRPTDFVRTTQDRHTAAVQHFWRALEKAGSLYQGKYHGWYCVSEEAFLSQSQLTEVTGSDGQLQKVSAETGHAVEWAEECNYMFKLTNYREDLLHWLTNCDVVKPRKFGVILRHMIEEGLEDLSVSRPKARLHWGIPVPGDDTQTIYVWLDALVNYLTVAGYPDKKLLWPPDVQVIGKDILKFHGIYWPAFLMAAGLEPPHRILCHSHWTVDHTKMSKSKGNVVDPFAKIRTSSSDAVRYFLLREGVPHSDGNYSAKKFANLVNAELADTFGNLLNRCTAKSLNSKQIFSRCTKDAFKQFCDKEGEELVQSVVALPDAVKEHYLNFNFYKGIEQIMACLRRANLFMQESKPWDLKGPSQKEQLETILHVVTETLRVCGLLLLPVTPSLSNSLLDKLGVQHNERSWQDVKPFASFTGSGKNCFEGRPLGTQKHVLFQKIHYELEGSSNSEENRHP